VGTTTSRSYQIISTRQHQNGNLLKKDRFCILRFKKNQGMAAGQQQSFSLLLLCCRSSDRIIYAEVDSTFLNFWCNLLTLPIGSFLKKLKEHRIAVSSFGRFYESLESIPESYFTQPKSTFLEANQGQSQSQDQRVMTQALALAAQHLQALRQFQQSQTMTKENFKFILTGSDFCFFFS
jgi:hypothetical protein